MANAATGLASSSAASNSATTATPNATKKWPTVKATPARVAPPPTTVPAIDRLTPLPKACVQAVMQFLERPSLIRLARSSRRLIGDAESPIVWKYHPPYVAVAPPKTDLFLERMTSGILRHLRVHYATYAEYCVDPEHVTTMVWGEKGEESTAFLRIVRTLGRTDRLCVLTHHSWGRMGDAFVKRAMREPAFMRLEELALLGSGSTVPSDFFTQLVRVTPRLRTLRIDDVTVYPLQRNTLCVLEGPASELEDGWPHLRSVTLLRLGETTPPRSLIEKLMSHDFKNFKTTFAGDFWSRLATCAPKIDELVLGVSFWQPAEGCEPKETLARLTSLKALKIQASLFQSRQHLFDAIAAMNPYLRAPDGNFGVASSSDPCVLDAPESLEFVEQQHLTSLDFGPPFATRGEFIDFHTTGLMRRSGSSLLVRIRHPDDYHPAVEMPEWVHTSLAPRFRYR